MNKRVTKGIFIFLCITAALLLAVTAVFLVARLFLSSFGDRVVAKESKVEEGTGALVKEDARTNLLVMGKDDASGLYDVLMLVSYNITDGSVSVVQIPRDTYLEYTEASYKKINGAVSALGGETELCSFLSKAMCVEIDNYISLDLDVVGKIVDELGGVEVNIPFDMNYKDPYQGLVIELKKGRTLLDGDMARQFIRYRAGYAEGDLGRIDAQKIFLAALASKLASSVSLVDVSTLLASCVGDIKTNISLLDMLSLARRAFGISPDKVSFVTLAGESAVAKSSGASYYVISRPSAIEIFNELLGGCATEESFDKNKVFLNEKYDSFANIYYSDMPYTVYDASSLLSGQLEVVKK